MHLHQVMERWPAEHPDYIQLFSKNTPNGIKVALALEEMHLAYDAHTIDLASGEQHCDAFHIISPNGRVPALIDPEGPDGHIISIMESGAILRYLSEKTGEFIPLDKAGKCACDQWLYFQSAHIGPCCHYYGLYQGLEDGGFHLTELKADIERGLSVLDQHLARHPYMLGESYSVADMATAPWIIELAKSPRYSAIRLNTYPALSRWQEKVSLRPAYARAQQVCSE